MGGATRPGFDLPAEASHDRKEGLIRDFVERRSTVALPDIRAVNVTAAAEIEEIQAQRFPEMARSRGAPCRSQRAAGRSRESLYRESLRLDSRVISSAFVWLDLRSARPDERHQWLACVHNLLGLTLSSIPQIDDPRQQEIEGLPDEFDSWVFSLLARAIPCLTAAENSRSLWQPILDLSSLAHQWIERFFWAWFTDGLHGAPSPDDFVRLWTGMIEHALASPVWAPGTNSAYNLDGMVFQLLGFDARMNKLGQNPARLLLREWKAYLQGPRSIGSACRRW